MFPGMKHQLQRDSQEHLSSYRILLEMVQTGMQWDLLRYLEDQVWQLCDGLPGETCYEKENYSCKEHYPIPVQ